MKSYQTEQSEQLKAVFIKPLCERMNKGVYEKRSQLFGLFGMVGA